MYQKKYFYKAIVFIFIGLVLAVLINQFYNRYIDENGARFYTNSLKKAKIVNLGSSHGMYGFNYENEEGINLGIVSQPLYYDYEIFKKYSSCLQEGGTVIIPISIFTFYKYNPNYLNIVNDNYRNILNYEQLYGEDLKVYLSNKCFRFISKPTMILKFIIKSIKTKKIVNNSFVQYSKNQSYEERKSNVEKRGLAFLGVNDERLTLNPNYNMKILLNLLDFIDKKGGKPILVTTPQTYLLNEVITSDNYNERLYKNIEFLKEKYGKKIQYLDYSHDERFENNLDLFFDNDHLNKKGAKKFTKIVLDDLKGIGLY